VLNGLWNKYPACYNWPVKKTKILPGFLPDSLIPYLNWIWLALSLGLWTWEQYAHAAKGIPFSWMIYAKGAILLTEAAFLYRLVRFHAFYFLGMFPLAWLALSRFQWDLCSMGEYRFWVWLAFFLGMGILILALPDGKKLLPALALFWAGLIWLFKFSFLLPLAFITVPSKRFKNASWVRLGGLAAGVVLFLAFRGWIYFSPGWTVLVNEGWSTSFLLLGWLAMGLAVILFFFFGGLGYLRQISNDFLIKRRLLVFLLFLCFSTLVGGGILFLIVAGWIYFHPISDDFLECFVDQRFFAFLLLGWLGLAAYDSRWKGTFRHILTPIFLLPMGFIFWGGQNIIGIFELKTLEWVLVFAAGYGWEAFRKHMMDSSWHGRLVWFALGLAFFGGVI
jgi:hypothetical protein